MKKRIPLYIMTLLASALFTAGLVAQETTEVTIKVTKDGKVVKDTSYLFDDADEAKHAMKLMEMMSGDQAHVMKYNYTMDSDSDKHSNTMVFISRDGEKAEIKEIHGDSLVWVTEKEIDGENVKVIKRKMKGGAHPHGEHVIVMKSGDGDSFDILIDEDTEAGDGVKTKKMNVIVTEDGDGNWHVDEKEIEVEVVKKVKKKSEKQ